MALQRPVISEPVSFAQDDNPNLARNLKRDLETVRSGEAAAIVNSAKDWADYQKRSGIIEGLDIAISLCEKADAKLKA